MRRKIVIGISLDKMNDYSAMRFLFRPWHAQDFFNIQIFNILTRIFFFRIIRGRRSCEFFLLNELLFNCQTWLLFAYNCVFKLRYFARDRCNLRGLAYNYFAYKVNISHSEVGSYSLTCFIFMKLFFKKIFSSKILHDTIVDIEVTKTKSKMQS